MKQKEQSEKERLLKLQKPAGQQVDERVDERVDFRMTSAVPETVQSILKDTLHPEAFKKTDEGKQKKKHGSKSISNKKHKHGSKQPNTQQILPSQVAVAMPSMLTQPQMASVNTILPTPMVSILFHPDFQIKGLTYNMLLFRLEKCHLSPFRTSTEEEETSTGGLVVVLLDLEEDAAGETLLDHKVRMMLIVWMLLLLVFSKTK